MEEESEESQNYQPRKPGRFFFIGWVMAVVLVLLATAGLVLARDLWLARAGGQLDQQLSQGRRVLVAMVAWSPGNRSLDIPGEIHGFNETSIYAKIPGYLKTIRVDKGDRAMKGDVLAVLVSPELDHQVNDAIAAYALAIVTDRRTQSLLRQEVVSRQAADETHAAMLQARATLAQMRATQAYETIRAPFDGIVTARYVDPGALIPAAISSSTAATPVVAMTTLSPLRVYAEVPQSVAPFIADGMPAAITVAEYPGRVFEAAVTRRSTALNSDTRTMLVEVDLPNGDSALLPGMYARVRFEIPIPARAPLVPDDALIFDNSKVYVPVIRGRRLHLAEVTLGYDNGVTVEVTRGVAAGDLVALSVGQSARDGEVVQPVMAKQSK